MFSSVIAFLVGPLIDRYGARWLIVAGAVVAGAGYILLSQVQFFWHFMVIRWLPITVGDTLMGYMVINVMISRWFIHKRGRAISIANMGNGIAKAGIPLVAVGLFALVGWRNTWMVFGLVTLAVVVLPAFLLVRRSPEDIGLQPDGALAPPSILSRRKSGNGSPAGALRRCPMDPGGGRPDRHILAAGHHLRHRHLRNHRVEPAHPSLHHGHRILTRGRLHGHGNDGADADGGEPCLGRGRRAYRRAQGGRRPVPPPGVRPWRWPLRTPASPRSHWGSSSTDSASAGSW